MLYFTCPSRSYLSSAQPESHACKEHAILVTSHLLPGHIYPLLDQRAMPARSMPFWSLHISFPIVSFLCSTREPCLQGACHSGQCVDQALQSYGSAIVMVWLQQHSTLQLERHSAIVMVWLRRHCDLRDAKVKYTVQHAASASPSQANASLHTSMLGQVRTYMPYISILLQESMGHMAHMYENANPTYASYEQDSSWAA
eukprot:1149002-Pelagomonas_calceolata.AAC.2